MNEDNTQEEIEEAIDEAEIMFGDYLRGIPCDIRELK